MGLFLVLSLRIAYLQIYRRDFFTQLSERQHYGLFQIKAKRGRILSRNKDVLAESLNFYSVFADPFFINDKARYAKILSQELGVPRERLLSRLKMKGRRFVWVKRKINWHEKKQLEKLNLSGIGFIREDQRFYPEAGLFSSLLGLVDIDNNGIEGIELYYDHYLRGKQGWVRAMRDGTSQRLVLTPLLTRLQEGADLILTLDTRIQYWSDKYLREQVEEFQAKKGSVVVMDAASGDILALANYNGTKESGRGDNRLNFSRNDAAIEMFEPGSVFKVVALVAAIAEGEVPESIYCEDGRFRIPGSVLRDWRPYGELSFEEVFHKSSNIGVAKIVESMGRDKFYEYLRKFGLGERTGIDFPGEIRGSLRPAEQWSRTSTYIIPIGQEIGVNLLQLARIFAVIANGGNLVAPRLAEAVCRQATCKGFDSKKENIFSESVVNKARDILIGAVEQGTGERAAVEGEVIGGKTGTAQKFDLELGRYSPDRYRANFAGFILSTSRPVVIAVTIDEPKVSHFGGVVAAPLFQKIAEKIVVYDVE